MRKKFGIFVLFFLVLLSVVFVFFSPTIYQESNPFLVAYKTSVLVITGGSFAKLDDHRYIVRSTADHKQKLTKYLSEHNITLIDQMGAGLLFRGKKGERYTANVRMYTASFEIWDFNNQAKPEFVLP